MKVTFVKNILFVSALAALLCACTSGPNASVGAAGGGGAPLLSIDPPDYDTPRRGDPLVLRGVPNFYRIAPGLYRGGQPTAEGMQQLERLGVRTVVNLRSWHGDAHLVDGTDLDVIRIDMKAYEHPTDEQVERFLRIATDRNRGPVFVHCWIGSDRTGAMCAAYRIVVQGWSKDRAVREMIKGGYGFTYVFNRLEGYVRGMDVEAMRERLGIEPPQSDAP